MESHRRSWHTSTRCVHLSEREVFCGYFVGEWVVASRIIVSSVIRIMTYWTWELGFKTWTRTSQYFAMAQSVFSSVQDQVSRKEDEHWTETI